MDTEKPRIVIEERDENTLAIAGTDKTFRVPIRSFTVHAKQLKLWTSFDRNAPQSGLSGVVELSGRDEISIIGEDEPRSRVLNLRIVAHEELAIEKLHDEWIADDKNKRKPDVTVGYLDHDWEVGNDSEFFISVYLTPQRMDYLMKLAQAGRIEELTLDINMQLWVEFYHTPPSMSVVWLLRPNKRKPERNPELAHGRLQGLQVIQRKTSLEKPEIEQRDDADRDDGTVPTETPAQTGELEHLAALQAIGKTLKRLPWFILIGAILIALAVGK